MRDIADEGVFVARRDVGGKGQGMPRQQFVANVAATLDEIQQQLFQRALDLRAGNTREINDLDEFRAFFTPQDDNKPEIHGGFVRSHWTENPETDKVLKGLKVTIRCVPEEEIDNPGTCLFTGQSAQGRAVFAKAY